MTPRPAQARGWRRFLRPATLAVLALAVWLVFVGLTLWWARNDATQGLDLIEKARSGMSQRELAQGRASEPLSQAKVSFDSASRLLGSPALAPLRVLPVAGRQLRSGRKLTTAAAEVAGVGASAVGDARSALSRSHRSGPERVALLRELARIAGQAEARLATVDPGSGRALVSPLAARRQEFVDRLDEARRGLKEGRMALDGLISMLSGSRYLVLAANNAEMRAGSGMFLSIGELGTADGELSLSDFRPTSDLTLQPQVAPPIEDADLADRWGWLVPNREWRNLNPTPRFMASAALAARMWRALGQPAVDGVLAVDPIALEAMVRVTGPVSVGGRSLPADRIPDLLLHDQYVGLSTSDPQARRREQLGAIARSAFEALQQRDWDVAELASALAQAARGRHILGWSARPAEQQGWAAAKLDGSLGPSSVAVSILNQGGNKLDRFLSVDARMQFERSDRSVGATLEVLLQNVTPDGEPGYVAGPHPDSGFGAGDYSGVLSVNLPAEATAITVEGRETFAAFGPDGPTRVVAVPTVVRKGAAQSFTVRFRLPPGHGPLRVEPSARVPPVRWTGPAGSWESGEARWLSLT